MKLSVIESEFSVCKIKDISEVCFRDEFVFLSKTDDEISLVCTTNKKPTNNILAVEDNWKALKIDGQLEFSMVGVLVTFLLC